MKGPCIESVEISNFLSFGPNPLKIGLQPLNVIIGPNAVGKSNFLEVFRLLHTLPADIDTFVEEGSSSDDYFWKGEGSGPARVAVEAISNRNNIRHSFSFESDNTGGFFVEEEKGLLQNKEQVFFEKSPNRSGYLESIEVKDGNRRTTELRWKDTKQLHWGSFLSRISELPPIPYVSPLRSIYEGIRLYGSLSFGKNAAPRRSQKTDLDQGYLFEDGSNLANVIGAMQHKTIVINRLNDYMRELYPNSVRLVTGLLGNRIHLFLEELRMTQTIPANRLSDGTIRFLCLATIFLQPNPPPLVCIEEPELGLHPDIIRFLGQLMIEASSRMQLIVTTHSDILVSTLRGMPESILVASRTIAGTELRRLEGKEVDPWLTKYSLGELWLSGEIGGVRS